MRIGYISLLMLWAWGAGAVFGVGEAQAEFCDDPGKSSGALLAFAWPVAVIGITIEGGWGGPRKAFCQ